MPITLTTHLPIEAHKPSKTKLVNKKNALMQLNQTNPPSSKGMNDS